MEGLNENILQIELILHKLETGVLDHNKARRAIRNSLQNLGQISLDTSLSLPQTIRKIAQDCSNRLNKEMGLVSIRLCYAEILTPDEIKDCRPYIVQFIEKGSPQLTSNYWSNKNSQSHEKLDSVMDVHRDACNRLENLQRPFTSLNDLIGRRQIIMRDLNFGPIKNYLIAFGFDSVILSLSSLFALVDRATKSEGHELQTSVKDLLDKISDDLGQFTGVQTFIVREYFLPFLERTQNSAEILESSLAERFSCNIVTPPSPYEPEKKYPLHIVGSKIQIFVPLSNSGPGIAQTVIAHCVANNCDVQEEIILGDLEPGSFVLPLDITVTESCRYIDLEVEIQWFVIGDSSNHNKNLSVTIKSQRADLDWNKISQQVPYSLEVAYDNEFHGREDVLRRILTRLAPNSMQSCYITGQKRVGKSSLAHAVETCIRKEFSDGDYHTKYLECGEIMHSTGEQTLQELGRNLEEFLVSGLQDSGEWIPGNYSSTLLPLNRLIRLLENEEPDSRFVVFLDEFDEINESLYRIGELASTFFLNLRTLSSRRNIAFVLIGAERMPFVMESQGEKLNKFERESLDSFNQNTEWADYRALVETPIKDSFKLHEPALRKLFNLSNGHPYFTKMLCTAFFQHAVETKDAEISGTEIEKATERLIATLDVNSFAHYWRDGIYGDSEEIETVALQRRCLLIAWARTARSGKKSLTTESIEAHVHTSQLSSGQVLTILENFCQRGVFKEYDGRIYLPSVELFGNWLREGGFSKLVSNLFSEELAEAKQNREDNAYVQSYEIVEVAEKWDCYQGQKITEDKIRAWLEQVDSQVEQRLLFKLLENVRFINDLEIREKFSQVHIWIKDRLPNFYKSKRAQRRRDIIISHIDGAGKSGEHYASLYASANDISRSNLVHPSKLEKNLNKVGGSEKFGLVIVDDMIGTGNNLTGKLSEFSELFKKTKVGTKIPLLVVVLCGTIEGENKVRKFISENLENADLEICEILESKHIAFNNDVGFWETENEKDEAKTLLTQLGARIQKLKPLGYGHQGLLLTFSRNCPNNCLPILYGSGRGDRQWKPLFPRLKS